MPSISSRAPITEQSNQTNPSNHHPNNLEEQNSPLEDIDSATSHTNRPRTAAIDYRGHNTPTLLNLTSMVIVLDPDPGSDSGTDESTERLSAWPSNASFMTTTDSFVIHRARWNQHQTLSHHDSVEMTAQVSTYFLPAQYPYIAFEDLPAAQLTPEFMTQYMNDKKVFLASEAEEVSLFDILDNNDAIDRLVIAADHVFIYDELVQWGNRQALIEHQLNKTSSRPSGVVTNPLTRQWIDLRTQQDCAASPLDLIRPQSIDMMKLRRSIAIS